MKYAIFGTNRVAKDFMYIFDQLNIVCFFGEQELIKGIATYSIEDYYEKKSLFDLLIICDFDKTQKISIVKKMGLIEGKDYVIEETFFDSLDEFDINPDKKQIAVWGTGRNAKKLLDWDSSLIVSKYIDSYKKGFFDNKIIENPNTVIAKKEYFIIIAIRNNDNIVSLLENNGYIKWKDYCTDEEYKARLSQMLKKTIFDRNCYDFRCDTMLNHMEIGSNGVVICCCSTFINNSLGRIGDASYNDIWKSNIHKIMCLSTENRTYSFCKKDMCPLFIGRNNKSKLNISETYKSMNENPSTIALGYDTTCNLYCITCRDKICIEKGDRLEKIIELSKYINESVIPYGEFLILAGDGEVFLSKAYKEIYLNPVMKNVKYLRFLSNGMLFNELKWKEIKQYTDAKIMITFSIDAATKATYESIRRGGNFDILKKNMEYAAKLRKKGELTYLRFNFVVQAMNYEEMPEFVRWGKELGVDEIFFTKILNWGTYSDEEFKNISMMLEDGITPKTELQEVLNNPIMSDPIVDLGTIRYHHEKIDRDYIDNYYRWELERKVMGIFDK